MTDVPVMPTVEPLDSPSAPPAQPPPDPYTENDVPVMPGVEPLEKPEAPAAPDPTVTPAGGVRPPPLWKDVASQPAFQQLSPQEKQINFLKWSEALKQYSAAQGESPKNTDLIISKAQSAILPTIVGPRVNPVMSQVNAFGNAVGTGVGHALSGALRSIGGALIDPSTQEMVKTPDWANKAADALDAQIKASVAAVPSDPYDVGVPNPIDPSKPLVDPGTLYRTTSAVGSALPVLGAAALNPIAGIAVAAAEAKGGSYDQKLQENKQAGMTDDAAKEDADIYSSRKMLYTIPQTAVFLGAGALATRAAGIGGSALAQTIRGGAAAFAANVVAGDAIRNIDDAIDGKFQAAHLAPNLEDTVTGALFAIHPAYEAGSRWQKVNDHYNSVITGDHPEIQKMAKGVEDLRAAGKDDAADEVQSQINELQRKAKIELYKMGSRVPDVVAAFKGEAADAEATVAPARAAAASAQESAPLTAAAINQKADAEVEARVASHKAELDAVLGPANDTPDPITITVDPKKVVMPVESNNEVPAPEEQPPATPGPNPIEVSIPTGTPAASIGILSRAIDKAPIPPASKTTAQQQIAEALQSHIEPPAKPTVEDHTTLAGAQKILALSPDEQAAQYPLEVRQAASKIVAEHNAQLEQDAAQQKIAAQDVQGPRVISRAEEDKYLTAAEGQLIKTSSKQEKALAPEESSDITTPEGEPVDQGGLTVTTGFGEALLPHAKLLNDRSELVDQVVDRVRERYLKHVAEARAGKRPLYLPYKEGVDTITPKTPAEKAKSVKIQMSNIAKWSVSDVLKAAGSEPDKVDVNAGESAETISPEQAAVVAEPVEPIAPTLGATLDQVGAKESGAGKVFTDYLKGRAGLPNDSNFDQTTKLKDVGKLAYPNLAAKAATAKLKAVRDRVHASAGKLDAALTPDALTKLEYDPKTVVKEAEAAAAEAPVDPDKLRQSIYNDSGRLPFKRAVQEEINDEVSKINDPETLNKLQTFLRSVEKDDDPEWVTGQIHKIVEDRLTTPVTPEENFKRWSEANLDDPMIRAGLKIDPDLTDEQKQQLLAKWDAQATTEQATPESVRTRLNTHPKGGGIPVPLFEDLAHFGEQVYEKVKDPAAWRAEMGRNFGDAVKPHLDDLWSRITGKENAATKSETYPGDNLDLHAIGGHRDEGLKLFHTSATAVEGKGLETDPRVVFEGDGTTKSPQMGIHFGSSEQTRGLKGTQREYSVDIKNPLELPDLDNWSWQKVEAELKSKGLLTPEDEARYSNIKKTGGFRERILQEIIKDKGYDGIKYLNKFEGNKNDFSYIAFDRDQIKPTKSPAIDLHAIRPNLVKDEISQPDFNYTGLSVDSAITNMRLLLNREKPNVELSKSVLADLKEKDIAPTVKELLSRVDPSDINSIEAFKKLYDKEMLRLQTSKVPDVTNIRLNAIRDRNTIPPAYGGPLASVLRSYRFGNGLSNLLEQIRDQSSSRERAGLIDKLLAFSKHLDTIQTQIGVVSGGDPASFNTENYINVDGEATRDRMVTFAPDIVSRRDFERHAIHETVHGLLAEAAADFEKTGGKNLPPEALPILEGLKKEYNKLVKSEVPNGLKGLANFTADVNAGREDSDLYGLTSFQEFLPESVVNSNFQTLLEDRGGVLAKIVKAFKKLIGTDNTSLSGVSDDVFKLAQILHNQDLPLKERTGRIGTPIHVEDQPETQDPYTGSPTRLGSDEGPVIARGSTRSERLQVPKLAAAIRGVKAVKSFLQRGPGGLTHSNLTSNLLAKSEADFAEAMAKNNFTPQERAAITEMRKAHPRMEWEKIFQLTNTADMRRMTEVASSWDKRNSSTETAQEYISRLGAAAAHGLDDASQQFILQQVLDAHDAIAEGQLPELEAYRFYRDMMQSVLSRGKGGNWQFLGDGSEGTVFRAGNYIYKILHNDGKGRAGFRPAPFKEVPLYRVDIPRPMRLSLDSTDSLNNVALPSELVPYITPSRSKAEAARRANNITEPVQVLGPKVVSGSLQFAPVADRLQGIGTNLPGFMATDAVGVTPSGDLIIKQSFVDKDNAGPLGGTAIKQFAADHDHIDMRSNDLNVPFEERSPVLQSGASDTVSSHPIMIRDGDGRYYIALDIREGNGFTNGIDQYMTDPIIRPLTPQEISNSPILSQFAGELKMQQLVGAESDSPDNSSLELHAIRPTTAMKSAREAMSDEMAKPFEGYTYETETHKARAEAAQSFLSKYTDPMEAFVAIDQSALSPTERIVTRGYLAHKLDGFGRAFDKANATPQDVRYADSLETLRQGMIKKLMDDGSAEGQQLEAWKQIANLWSPETRVRDYKQPIKEEHTQTLPKVPEAVEINNRLKKANEEAGKETIKKLEPALQKMIQVSLKQSGAADDPYAQSTFDFFQTLADAQAKAKDEAERLDTSGFPAVVDIQKSAADTIARQVIARFTEIPKTPKEKAFLEQLETQVRDLAMRKVNEVLAPARPAPDEPLDPDTIGKVTQKDIDRLSQVMERATAAEGTFNDMRTLLQAKAAADPEFAAKVAPILEAQFDAARLREVTQAVKRATDIKELARKTLVDQQVTAGNLTASILANSDLDAHQARAAANYLHSAFSQELRASATKQLDDMVARAAKEKKTRPVSMDSQKRLLELANLGGFQREDVFNAIAPDYNLNTYDPKVAAEIERRARIIQDLPYNSSARVNANTELDNYIRRQTPASVWQMLMQLQSANLLFRFSTMAVVPTSTAFNSAADMIMMAATTTGAGNRAKLISAALGSFRTLFEGGSSKTASEIGAMLRGDTSSVLGAFMEADRHGHGNSTLERMAQAHAEGEDYKLGNKRFNFNVPASVADSKGFARVLAAIGRGIDIARFIPRTISMMHTLTRPAVTEMRFAAETVRKLKAEGLEPGTARFNARYATEMGHTDAQLDRAWEQAKAEGKQFGWDKHVTNKRANELVNMSRDQELVHRADEYSKTVTSSSDLYGFNGRVAQTLQGFAGDTFVFQPLIKFLRAASNLATIAENYLPVYSIKRLFSAPGSTLRNIDRNASLRRFVPDGPSTATGLRGKFENTFKSAPRGVDFNIQLGKTILGHTLVAGLMVLLKKSLTDPDAELKIIGDGPQDYDGKRLFTAAGGKTDSIRVKFPGSDHYTYISYQNIPGNSLFKLFGQFSDSYLEAPPADKESLVSRMAIAVMQAPFEIFNLSMMQGVQNLTDLSHDLGSSEKSDQGSALRLLKRMASSTAASFVPLAPGLSQFDLGNAHAGNFFQDFIKGIPIAKHALDPELDMFGKPTAHTLLERFGKNETADPIYQTLAHLGLAIKFPQTQHLNDFENTDDNGKPVSRELTDDEHYRWVANTGPEMYDALAQDPSFLQQLKDTYANEGPDKARELLGHRLNPIKTRHLKAIERGDE